MVNTRIAQRRNVPGYPLERVHELAAKQDVTFAGKRVFENTSELGLELDDVCECLGDLTDLHFKESIQYEDLPSWHDVYLITLTVPSGDCFDMYIKFKMFGERLVLLLCSFHPEGWKG